METMPDEFWLGVDAFNQRQFYACHDTLEALWIEAMEPEKKFYQGILQVAVGLYHLGNRNWRGAVILMGEGLNRLRDYPPDYAGVDVDRFRDETVPVLQFLQNLGADRVDEAIQTLGYATPSAAELPLPQIHRLPLEDGTPRPTSRG